MLEIRPCCECCATALPPDAEAYICSLECTFCPSCTHEVLAGTCLNCGGNLTRRPVRPSRWLEKYPASTRRVVTPDGRGGQ